MGECTVNFVADRESPKTGAIAFSSVPSENTTFSGMRTAEMVVVAEPADGLLPSMVYGYGGPSITKLPVQLASVVPAAPSLDSDHRSMPRAGKATILPSSGSEGLPCGTILWGTQPDVGAGPAWGGCAPSAAAIPAKTEAASATAANTRWTATKIRMPLPLGGSSC